MIVNRLRRLEPLWLRKARAIRRNDRDLGQFRSNLDIHPIAPANEDLLINRIRSVYKQYTSEVSSPVAAISWELASYLWSSLWAYRPTEVLDLGSGFSSFLFRLFAKTQAENGHACQVISIDDNSDWLERTREFLEAEALPTQQLWLWDDYIQRRPAFSPGLVLYDLGHSKVRINTLPAVVGLCQANTRLVADDVQKPLIREALLKVVQSRQLRCQDLISVTYDRYGRYSWLIHGFGN
jgi:hypothetical protein